MYISKLAVLYAAAHTGIDAVRLFFSSYSCTNTSGLNTFHFFSSKIKDNVGRIVVQYKTGLIAKNLCVFLKIEKKLKQKKRNVRSM